LFFLQTLLRLQNKTRQQLINELAEMQQRIAELEDAEEERERKE